MAHIVHIVLRVLAGIAGAIAIYAALFLYEDEQGKIENQLAEWWVRLDDQRNAAVSRHTAFMREVARLAEHGFERLFGQKLFSMQAFGVSSALSLTSAVGTGVMVRGKNTSVSRKIFPRSVERCGCRVCRNRCVIPVLCNGSHV